MEVKEIALILRETFLQYGEDLFLNDERLKAALADLLVTFPKERRLIGQAIDEGVVKRIVNEPQPLSPLLTNSLVKRFMDVYSTMPEISWQVISVISYAVHGEYCAELAEKAREKNNAYAGQESEYHMIFHKKRYCDDKIFDPETNEYHIKFKK